MEELVTFLINRNISISSVESFTVGGFASLLGSFSGISKVYRGSLVSYQTCIKRDVLNIDEKVINEFGVVSKETAGLMAINGQKMFNSDICISFTGNAGPSAMEGKPVGLVYIGITFYDQVKTMCFQLNGSRQQIKEQAIYIGCYEILKLLKTDKYKKEEV